MVNKYKYNNLLEIFDAAYRIIIQLVTIFANMTLIIIIITM